MSKWEKRGALWLAWLFAAACLSDSGARLWLLALMLAAWALAGLAGLNLYAQEQQTARQRRMNARRRR